MADIAMLVAEEYERKVKDIRKAGGGSEAQHQIDMVSCVSVLTERLKQKTGVEKRDLVNYNWVWQPKTQIGIAASNSFFSA